MFEDFASGRFTKQEVLARMTERGLRTRRGLVVSPQSFGQMLRCTVYIGRIESPEFGVSTRGDFEPLISEQTFYRADRPSRRLDRRTRRTGHPGVRRTRFTARRGPVGPGLPRPEAAASAAVPPRRHSVRRKSV